eukprot:CAMPEP_0168742454 /NCGR_PEP_ID=MMETSP0724-20121128/13044_1 /TAXON_ID=265536 /ORGANISM="Amphiprora sp., Strain CCMP467" /LENGTH=487 /DNA_ID=CAMNT_0008790003 /DNA_START=38 /DNA_END=1501 /DNA_ORIENTATION=+
MTFWNRLKDELDNEQDILPAWFAFLVAAASIGCMYCGVNFCVGAAKDHDDPSSISARKCHGDDDDDEGNDIERFANDRNDSPRNNSEKNRSNNNATAPVIPEKSVSFAMQDFAPVLAWFIKKREERKKLNRDDDGNNNENYEVKKDFQYLLNLMNGGGVVEYMAAWEIVFTFSGGALVLGLLQTLNFELVLMLVTLIPVLAFLCISLFFECLFTLGSAKPYHSGEHLEAVSIFHDLNGTFVRQTCLGLGQVALLVMYGWGLYESGLPDFTNRRVYGFYWAGVFLGISYVVGKNVRKNVTAHEKRFWSKALSAFRDGKKLMVKDGPNRGRVFTPNQFQIHIRFLLGMLVNTCGASLIILGLPIQLAGIGGNGALPDPMELVLNSIAAFYIFEVDDLSESITFEIVDSDRDEKDVYVNSTNAALVQQHRQESFETLRTEMKDLHSRLNRALLSTNHAQSVSAEGSQYDLEERESSANNNAAREETIGSL